MPPARIPPSHNQPPGRRDRLLAIPVVLLALVLSVGAGGDALLRTYDSLRHSTSPFRRIGAVCQRFAPLRAELPPRGIFGYVTPFVLRTRADGSFADKREFIQNLRGMKNGVPRIDAKSYVEARNFIRRMRIAQYCMAPHILDAGSASASGTPLPLHPDTTIADLSGIDPSSAEIDLSGYRILKDYGDGLLLLAERRP